MRLAEYAFAVGIGSGRGVGVLFDTPEIIVDDVNAPTRRRIVPRPAIQNDDRWQPVRVPAHMPATDVDTNRGSDVTYGHILDRATGLCGGEGGVYIAMLAFPTLPYLAFYHAVQDRFWARPLSPSQAIVGLIVQRGRLHYIHAGSAELRSVEVVDAR
jgi:hypothetical protein